MADLLVDANVFMYAAGGPHRYREPCRRLVRAIGTDGLVAGKRAVIDTELLQEVAYRYASTGRARVGVSLQRSILALGMPVLAVDASVIRRFASLQDAYATEVADRHVSVRDVLHLAVMFESGVDTVLTADRDFERFSGVTRLDPEEASRAG